MIRALALVALLFPGVLHPALASGPHSIAVRATDEEGNVGVEKVSVRIK